MSDLIRIVQVPAWADMMQAFDLSQPVVVTWRRGERDERGEEQGYLAVVIQRVTGSHKGHPQFDIDGLFSTPMCRGHLIFSVDAKNKAIIAGSTVFSLDE